MEDWLLVAYRDLANRDIASLKLQLQDAEQNLKCVTKMAEERHERLAKELSTSDARDNRNIIQCDAEVARVKKLLEQKVCAL